MLSPSLRAALAVALLSAPLASCGSRTGLNDRSYRSEAFTCSEAAWRARPSVPQRLYAGVPQRLWGQAVWRVIETPPGATATITHNGGEDALFVSPTEGDYLVEVTIPSDPDAGTASDAGGDASAPITRCVLRVTVRASGPVALCPPTLVTQPLRRVELNGNAQADRGIDEVEWTLLDAPLGSGRPAPSPSDSLRTGFTPDVAGDYRVQLRVSDEAGARDQCTTIVRAVPSEGLRIEMSWDPPGRTCPSSRGAACDDSDVDLHLLRAAAQVGWGGSNDCHWFNCNVSAGRRLTWGGGAANPRLDLDDVTGHGPENVNIDRPNERTYRVGVHYYAPDGAGMQAATVTIYCGSATPAARLGPVTLRNQGTPEDGDFWYVADVLPIPTGGCEVRPILRGGAPWVVRYGMADSSGPPSP